MSLNSVFDSAQSLLRAGKPLEAADLLSSTAREPAAHPLLRLTYGLALVDGGQHEAVNLVREVVESEQGNGVLRLFLARALYDAGDLEGAEQEAELLRKQQPEHPGPDILRALCEAARQPQAGLHRLALGAFCGDPELAGRALLIAESVLLPIEHRPNTALWPANLLPWNRTDGAPSEELAIVKRDLKSLRKRIGMLAASGAHHAAVVIGEVMMQMQPSDEVLVELAELYLQTGQFARLEAALRDHFPGDPERNSYYGIALFHLGHLEEAADTLDRAETGHARSAHTLGQALLALRRPDEARRAFIRTARLDEAIPVNRVAQAALTPADGKEVAAPGQGEEPEEVV